MTMQELKKRYSDACAAFLRGDPDAVERCETALRDLQAAQRRERLSPVPSAKRRDGARR